MGNSGRSEYIDELERLASSEDAVVAEHAIWAIGKLNEKNHEEYFSPAQILASAIESE